MADYTRYRADGTSKRVRRGATTSRGSGPLGPWQEPRGGHLWAKVLKLIALTIVAVIGLTGGLAFGWLQHTTAKLATNHPGLVQQAIKQLAPPLPGQAENILVMGADSSDNSDSIEIVRLDPQTKSISLLSVPRDLWVNVPGIGMSKINAALPYGGPALAIKVIEQATGVPINHFISINFTGFWDIVKILGGVYLQIDRQYTDIINGQNTVLAQPGYQLTDSYTAMHYVRFRHDQYLDFGRSKRQQIFITQLQRQAVRWRSWTQLPKLVATISQHADSDISSLRQLLSIASLVLQMNTSHIYTTRIQGATPTIDGQDVVTDTPAQIQAAVQHFLHPSLPPTSVSLPQAKTTPKPKATASPTLPPSTAFAINVLNGSGKTGVAASTSSALVAAGYRAAAAGNAASFTFTNTVIAAPASLAGQARSLAKLLAPATVQLTAGSSATVTVTVGSLFGGQLATNSSSSPTPTPTTTATGSTIQMLSNTTYGLSAWQQAAAQAHLPVMVPTVWANGFTLDGPAFNQTSVPFRAYSVNAGNGNMVPAFVAVLRAPTSVDPDAGTFDIQAIHWTNPPYLLNPTLTKKVGSRRYLFYYDESHLTAVAFVTGGNAYWVTNTLNNDLPNNFLIDLALSLQPLK
jgi:LCP family protein required for cell wall assembly